MNLRSFTALVLMATCFSVAAQTATPSAAPSTEQMIEQLKAPRTRSLRNLVVEANPTAGPSTGAASAPAAAQAPEPRPSLSLSVQFDFNSSRIRAESFDALSNLATALNSPALAQSKFLIEGHTDAKGGQDYNRKLSEQRAQSVKELLASKGVDAAHLVSVGKGSGEPANKADPLAAENRRVRIVNLD
jgi:outer membrane protein OmpA-like peptidoglycan-associated protein